MILRSTGGAGATSSIGRSIDSVSQYLGLEIHVVRHDGSGQMMAHAFQGEQHSVKGIVVVGGDDLEWSKQFRHTVFKVFFLDHFLEWNIDGSGFDGAISFRNVMVFELLSSKEYLSARDASQLVRVLQKSLRCVSQDRSDRQICQVSLRRVLLDFLEKPRLFIILVHKHNGLRRTLLSTQSVRILVALPSNVVNVGDIRSKNLPIKACILDLDFSTRCFAQQFPHTGGSSELSQTDGSLHNELLGDWTTAV
mmetsp:Transcript_28489/g.47131  ORF Transcript_28489/g.47131 Transcript_28489/m.47131 type:complete len:251 (-) Transcript_28489:209-961(-)